MKHTPLPVRRLSNIYECIFHFSISTSSPLIYKATLYISQVSSLLDIQPITACFHSDNLLLHLMMKSYIVIYILALGHTKGWKSLSYTTVGGSRRTHTRSLRTYHFPISIWLHGSLAWAQDLTHSLFFWTFFVRFMTRKWPCKHIEWSAINIDTAWLSLVADALKPPQQLQQRLLMRLLLPFLLVLATSGLLLNVALFPHS